MNDDTDRPTVAERAARAGARIAHERFRTGIDVETKSGKTDVVTAADRAAQREVIDVVRETYPGDAVVGEEEEELKAVPEDGAAWVIDPIDGTNNYVRGLRTWATAVGAVVDGEPVGAATALPALDDVYTADGDDVRRNDEPVAVSDVTDPERATVVPTVWWDHDHRDEYGRACTEIVDRFADLRRFGCAQAALANVADGGVEGVITNVQCHPWDTVAGVFMVRQAGGTVTDLEGNRWRHDSRGLVASNGGVHDEVLAAARAIED